MRPAQRERRGWPIIRGMNPRRARVAVADDDVLLREGLASLLESRGFEVVGQSGDATELIAHVRGHRPELALVEIRMPPRKPTEGLDAVRVVSRPVHQYTP